MHLIHTILITCYLISSSALAWWDTAHMLTVEVAKEHLNPGVQKKIEKIVGSLEKEFPKCSTLTTAACLPDDLTSLGLSGFKVWHGVLTPYDPDHFLSKKEKELIATLVSANNLHSALNQCRQTLENPDSGKWEQAFMLAFLLHTVGDIHQPLHCIHLYSKTFPNGDLAGHRFKLAGPRFKNLHQLWDSILGLGEVRFARPLNKESQVWVESFASELIKRYPMQSFPQLNEKNSMKWSEESYQLAISHVYRGIEPNQEPSDSYISQGQEIALSQIVLAGYRLAHLLNEIF